MEQRNSGESDVQKTSETLLTTSSPLQTNLQTLFLKPPALLVVNPRAGPVGSVWGLAPGSCGRVRENLPVTLLAQPRGTERSHGVRWRQREEV
jgi:hypothetical protein